MLGNLLGRAGTGTGTGTDDHNTQPQQQRQKQQPKHRSYSTVAASKAPQYNPSQQKYYSKTVSSSPFSTTHHHNANQNSFNFPPFIDESSDSYLLYGVVPSQIKPQFQLSDKLNCLRMVVIQEKSPISTAQTLFDSAAQPQIFTSTGAGHTANYGLNKQIHHSVHELCGFMWGAHASLFKPSVFPSTSFFVLPALPAMSASLLITRSFWLDPSFETTSSFSLANKENGSQWMVKPSVVFDDTPLVETGTTRFAIGLVIPIASTPLNVQDIVTDHWPELASHLATLQIKITDKLRQLFLKTTNNNNNANKKKPLPYHTHSHSQPQLQLHTHKPNHPQGQPQTLFRAQSPVNNITMMNKNKKTKMQFPNHILQNDPDMIQLFNDFKNSLVFLNETPRLFIPIQNSQLQLLNWCGTVESWMRYKDGRYFQPASSFPSPSPFPSLVDQQSSSSVSVSPNLKFLATLLSLIVPHKETLLQKPMDRSKKETVRVVIVTSNPAVSQKLILILAGVLGYEWFDEIVENVLHDERRAEKSRRIKNKNNNNSNNNNQADADAGDDDGAVPEAKEKSAVKPIPITRQINTTTSTTSTTSTSTSTSTTSKPKQPTPTVPTPLQFPFTSTNSPTSAATTTTTTSTTINVIPQRISMPQLRRASSYASLQSLSTSYGSNSGSTAITGGGGSWRLGSLLERWRNSSSSSFIGSGGSGSGSGSNGGGNSVSNSYTNSNNFGLGSATGGAGAGGFLNTPSFEMGLGSPVATPTPGGGVEGDEYPWNTGRVTAGGGGAGEQIRHPVPQLPSISNLSIGINNNNNNNNQNHNNNNESTFLSRSYQSQYNANHPIHHHGSYNIHDRSFSMGGGDGGAVGDGSNFSGSHGRSFSYNSNSNSNFARRMNLPMLNTTGFDSTGGGGGGLAGIKDSLNVVRTTTRIIGSSSGSTSRFEPPLAGITAGSGSVSGAGEGVAVEGEAQGEREAVTATTKNWYRQIYVPDEVERRIREIMEGSVDYSFIDLPDGSGFCCVDYVGGSGSDDCCSCCSSCSSCSSYSSGSGSDDEDDGDGDGDHDCDGDVRMQDSQLKSKLSHIVLTVICSQ
ncbi:unnamed protein product [Ambrosiozyma monospora]|uniref:Unnamed protein product n=1 Tax=Ambrosiozyma monospora TaxID=43982 RepID=A0ACB5SZV9_AMBMO|nr:unnamed protein product [Ambrosiozyma monospora]